MLTEDVLSMKLRKSKLFDFLQAPLRSKFSWGAYDDSNNIIILAMWEPEVYWNQDSGICRVWVDSAYEPEKRKNPNNEERGVMVQKIKTGFSGFCLLSKNDPAVKAEFGELDIEKDSIYKIRDIIHNEKTYYALLEKHSVISDFLNPVANGQRAC